VGIKLRKHLRTTYREPENAFSAFNDKTRDTITLDSVLNHPSTQGLGFEKQDLAHYLLRDKVFLHPTDLLDFGSFRKMMFPHLTLLLTSEEAAAARKE
jgi:hypothetical protein